jgi:hypothetical protein
MKRVIILAAIILMASGCSSGQQLINPVASRTPSQATHIGTVCKWTWDAGLYKVSEDHTTIERLSMRTANPHMNVTPFVEPPHCTNCLMMGKPQVQVDGTIKVKVILTHPFPGQKLFTGFDVKGTIIFPSTRNWMLDNALVKKLWTIYEYSVLPDHKLPINFSRAEDGGGQLLNQDGYTFYLSPWLDKALGPEFEAPIYNYSQGYYAHGPTPDSNINAFKLFTKDPERRMFRVTDTIGRTYHIAPPEGEFIFGYVVDASWAPPEVNPVTNPKTDFPFWANAEEGYVLDCVQIAPFKMGTYYSSPEYPDPYDVMRVEMLISKELWPVAFHSVLICPDIKHEPDIYSDWIAHSWTMKKKGEGLWNVRMEINNGSYEAPSGQYVAVLVGFHDYNQHAPPFEVYSTEFWYPPFCDIITIDVVEGD